MPAKPSSKTAPFNCVSLAAWVCMATLGLAGCGSFNTGLNASAANPVNWLTPYKVDVIQGNFVSKEQVETLKAGMSRAQVKDVLGTPLVASLFHADRWDYVFTFRRQGVEPQSLKYAVFFKGDQLERFEGDKMPTDAEFIASLTNDRKIGKVPLLQATEEQLKAADKSSAAAVASTTATGNLPLSTPVGTLPANYPPLESARP